MLRKREELARKEAEVSSRDKGLQLQVSKFRHTCSIVLSFMFRLVLILTFTLIGSTYSLELRGTFGKREGYSKTISTAGNHMTILIGVVHCNGRIRSSDVRVRAPSSLTHGR